MKYNRIAGCSVRRKINNTLYIMDIRLFSHNFPLKRKWDFYKVILYVGELSLENEIFIMSLKLSKCRIFILEENRTLAIFSTVSLEGNYEKVICIICIF